MTYGRKTLGRLEELSSCLRRSQYSMLLVCHLPSGADAEDTYGPTYHTHAQPNDTAIQIVELAGIYDDR
ncbi:hypothetical protein ARMSODRAFT_1022237 [Armillaria solidipes]|uniref:Uncharacterized protein n=1 Tax=Armillaria solidipes TaxID=1076256 RepID=A0A2H3BHB0_9AGAR|nr:hypothetical protein ARMSODRAFT_1022237 [Armillaria solidipes]